MATYKPAIEKGTPFHLFTVIAALIHAWSYVQLFYQIPAWSKRMDLFELLGATSYVLVAALIESLLFAGLFLLPGLLPADWFRNRYKAIASALFATMLAAVAFIQYNFEKLFNMSYALTWMGISLLMMAVVFFLFWRFEQIASFWSKLVERISILGLIYLAIDLPAIIILIIRNLP